MNKVFIPDNEGGGTWEPWKDDQPNYKAHAEALAEALREAVKIIDHNHPSWNKLFDALGAYEAAQ